MIKKKKETNMIHHTYEKGPHENKQQMCDNGVLTIWKPTTKDYKNST